MKTLSLGDVATIKTPTLALPEDWALFLGKLPRYDQWKMIVHGGSFSGKSSWALVLAGMLSRYGKVLYGNFEESVNGGSIQNKLNSLGLRNANIEFLKPNTLENFTRSLDEGNFKFAIIDSLSVLGNNRKEILESFNIYKRYPKVSFIYLLHADKLEKTYIGPSAFKHNVDIAIELIETIAISRKNRYKDGGSRIYTQFDTFKKKIIKPLPKGNIYEKEKSRIRKSQTFNVGKKENR